MTIPETSRSGAPGALCALVTVRWGDAVLATRRVLEGEDAVVGAAIKTMMPLPCEPLGVPSVTVAAVRGGAPVAFVPRGAIGFRERAKRLPSPVAGPSEITLSEGETVSFQIGGFVVLIAAEEASRAPWAGASPLAGSLSTLRYIGVAALVHAVVIGMSAQAAYASSFEDRSAADQEDLRRFLAASEDRSRADEKVVSDLGEGNKGRDVNQRDGDGKDGGGARARGVEGSMGSTPSRDRSPSRFAVAGGARGDRAVASTREQEILDAKEFGLVGLLQASPSSAPISAWGAAPAGADPFAATGDMWGSSIGETWGGGGLGLTGVGQGGGGAGQGIGIGTIGTIGHTLGRPGEGTGGGGTMSGGGFWGGSWGGTWREGIGISLGRIGTIGHGASATYDLSPRPRERPRDSDDAGEARLPRETIQRVVRQSNGTFRACYQSGLVQKPTLAGGVTTRFLIGADGHVKSASNLGADLPDSKVIACVTRAFYSLVFPEPPGGRPVTVTYPLTFSPVH